MIQMLNFSYLSTNLDFVYLCLPFSPFLTFVYLCLPLFIFIQLTHLCTNFLNSFQILNLFKFFKHNKRILDITKLLNFFNFFQNWSLTHLCTNFVLVKISIQMVCLNFSTTKRHIYKPIFLLKTDIHMQI